MEQESGDDASADSGAATLDGLRVGFLVDRWDPARGGGEAALSQLATRLSDCGAELTVFSERADRESLPAGASWRPVKVSGLTRLKREARLADALVAAAREAKMQVTIGTRHLSEVDLYWPHGGSYRVSLGARRHSRGRQPESNPGGRHRLFLELERTLLEQGGARRVVCVSELVRIELEVAYPACAGRLVTIPNGVDLERFHPRERRSAEGRGSQLRARLELESKTALLLFSAREPHLKGLPQLLEALGRIRGSGFRLLVAGVRRWSPWRALVRKHGLGEHVIHLPEADPVALSSAADLCVLPTWRDSSSLVILECLASGTPVVTTDRAGAASAICKASAGCVLSDPGDVSALRESIESRLDSCTDASEADRKFVRTSVSERGLDPWLSALALEVAHLR